MKKRVLVGLATVLVLAAGVVLVLMIFPALRFRLVGWFEGEPFHDGQATSYWVYVLKEGADQDREKAAYALGKTGAATTDVVPALTAALADKHYIVRRNAA